MELEITFCENQAIIYNYSKQKKLSFGNDLATHEYYGAVTPQIRQAGNRRPFQVLCKLKKLTQDFIDSY